MNILILSVGTRNKIVQYFKKELACKGLVMATDCSNLAPALYEADKNFIVPRNNADGYIDNILSICKENDIKAVFSLIDTDLSLISKNEEKFKEIGTTIIGSNYELCERTLDKWRMYKWLEEHNYLCAKSYIDKDEFYNAVKSGAIAYPVFVKPANGSASININLVNSRMEIDLLFQKYNNLIIQEFMNGIEYGVDVYVDIISGEVASIFIKEKIKMRAGETDKSVSIKDEVLFNLISDFVKKSGFKGIIDIDIFKVNNEYYISEVNTRFGGGYPHAYECGVNVPKMIINNLDGKANENQIGAYDSGIYMMKFNEVSIIRLEQ
jgi:carbamoyl-phosphate synthase large subunit